MLQEIYYWMIYHFKKIGTTELTEFNAYLLTCILVIANFCTLVMLGAYIFNIDIRTPHLKENATFIGISLGLFIMITLYFILYSKRKEIVDKYNHLKNNRKRKGIMIFWIYSMLSLFLLFYVGIKLYPS